MGYVLHTHAFAQVQVRMHVYVHLYVCVCIRIHLGTGMVQVCTCMTSCWKLSMAAILPFAFEVGCEGFSGLQVLCALYWCMLTCTYRYRHIAHCLLHLAHCMAQCTAVSGL